MGVLRFENHPIPFPDDTQSLGGHDPKVVDVLKSCLQRKVQERASIDQLLKHPYLKGEILTPKTRRFVLESLTKTSEKPAPPNFDD